jgi:hypothetical protein
MQLSRKLASWANGLKPNGRVEMLPSASGGSREARMAAHAAVYFMRPALDQSGKYTCSFTRLLWKSPYGKAFSV